MANPAYITTGYPSGFNLYAILRRDSDGAVWDVGDSAFEAVGTWNDARVDECDIALTDKSGGFYTAAFPTVVAGNYTILIFLRAGASPDTTDPHLGSAAVGQAGDEVHDEVIEGTTTFRQAMRLVLAVLTGKSSGGGSSTLKFRDIADSKDRLEVTVDATGNRTAVGTRDGS